MMEFLTEYNLTGLVIGVATFLIIGLFHPFVIKGEYYFGVRCWWFFLLMGVAAMPSAMNSVCAVWITRRMFCSRSSLRFTVCTSLRKVVYSMPCFHAVCNRKCASGGNICALHGAAQRGMLTADREIPPRRSGCLGPDGSRGLFYDRFHRS